MATVYVFVLRNRMCAQDGERKKKNYSKNKTEIQSDCRRFVTSNLYVPRAIAISDVETASFQLYIEKVMVSFHGSNDAIFQTRDRTRRYCYNRGGR